MVLAIYTMGIGERNHISQDRDIGVMAVSSEEIIQVPATKSYTKYAVELSVDPDGYSFEGIAKILYTHQYHRPTEEIVINSRGIEIKDIQINAAIVPFEQRGSITLIQSPFEIKKDEEITLTIQIVGTFIHNEKDPKGMASICNFLPTIPEYNEEYGWIKVSSEKTENLRIQGPGDYDVTIHTHKGQYPIATGTMNDISEKDNIITTSFSAKRVRDFGIFIGEPMEREVFNTQEGYSIVLYYVPGSLVGEEVIPMIKKSLSNYCHILGEYPYDQLTVIHKDGIGNGVAYPTMILGDFEKRQRTYTEINELVGKQWLGYIIGISEEECWLSEGLLAYLNKRFSFSQGQMEAYIEEQKKIEEKQKIDDPKGKNCTNTRNELAIRMLYEIETRIGEKAFEEALGVYYRDYSFQMPTGKDFIQLIEETTEINITHIYNHWLHKMELRESEEYESSRTSGW